MIPVLAICLSYLYRDAYTYVMTSSAISGLGINLLVGSLPRGLGSYMDQAGKGQTIDWRLVGKWMILGSLFHGIIMFSIFYPSMNYLGWLPQTKLLVHLTLFTLLVNQPFHFLAQKKFISQSGEKWKWEDMFLPFSNLHSIRSSMRLWMEQLLFVGTTYWVGWNYYPEKMNLITINTSIIWSWWMIYRLEEWRAIYEKRETSLNGSLQGQHVLGIAA